MLNELTEPTWIGHLIYLVIQSSYSSVGHSAVSRIGSPSDFKALLYSTHKENCRECRRISVRRDEFGSEFLSNFPSCYTWRELQVVAAVEGTTVDFITTQFFVISQREVCYRKDKLSYGATTPGWPGGVSDFQRLYMKDWWKSNGYCTSGQRSISPTFAWIFGI